MDKTHKEQKALFTLALGSLILTLALETCALYLSWNYGVSPIFKMPEITITQAFFLGLFISMLKPGVNRVRLSKSDTE